MSRADDQADIMTTWAPRARPAFPSLKPVVDRASGAIQLAGGAGEFLFQDSRTG